MKKILIPIAIVIVLGISVVAGYSYKVDATEKSTTAKSIPTVTEKKENTANVDNKTKATANNVNNKANEENKTQRATVATNSKETPPTTINKAIIPTNNTNKTNGNTSKITDTTPSTNTNTNNTNNTNTNTNNNSNKNVNNSAIIKVIPPSTNINNQFNSNTIIVENTTGKPISNSMLNTVIRNWILKWQFNYIPYCVATGENWAPQWLNAIPDSALINAFIEANGESSLSQNITAGEINKGAELYTDQSYKKPMPFPFSQAQAEIYIQQMLNEDSKYYGNNQIAKVVFHPGSAPNSAGLYYVYTKQMLAKGYKQPFWYVYSNTGQATGV